MRKKLPVVVGASLIAIASLMNQALADCLIAKGKISNNAQSETATLGVVALQLGNNKYKCAIQGVEPDSEFLVNGLGYLGTPNFRHTVVCDNKAASDEAQAQVTFNTWFSSLPTNIVECPDGSLGGASSFSFEEFSTPDAITARGEFQGITGIEGGSFINISGDYNCDGGIVMKFYGFICINQE